MERTQHSRPAWCVWHCRLCVALASDPSMLYAISSLWADGFMCCEWQTNRLHVRGIGVHGWDGTEEGKGDYESEAALRKIFERFGYFQNAMVRHRVQNGKNTSWALVTMADEAAVERALAAHAKQPVMAGRQELVLTRFSKAQGESSTGGMKQQVRVALPSVAVCHFSASFLDADGGCGAQGLGAGARQAEAALDRVRAERAVTGRAVQIL